MSTPKTLLKEFQLSDDAIAASCNADSIEEAGRFCADIQLYHAVKIIRDKLGFGQWDAKQAAKKLTTLLHALPVVDIGNDYIHTAMDEKQ